MSKKYLMICLSFILSSCVGSGTNQNNQTVTSTSTDIAGSNYKSNFSIKFLDGISVQNGSYNAILKKSDVTKYQTSVSCKEDVCTGNISNLAVGTYQVIIARSDNQKYGATYVRVYQSKSGVEGHAYVTTFSLKYYDQLQGKAGNINKFNYEQSSPNISTRWSSNITQHTLYKNNSFNDNPLSDAVGWAFNSMGNAFVGWAFKLLLSPIANIFSGGNQDIASQLESINSKLSNISGQIKELTQSFDGFAFNQTEYDYNTYDINLQNNALNPISNYTDTYFSTLDSIKNHDIIKYYLAYKSQIMDLFKDQSDIVNSVSMLINPDPTLNDYVQAANNVRNEYFSNHVGTTDILDNKPKYSFDDNQVPQIGVAPFMYAMQYRMAYVQAKIIKDLSSEMLYEKDIGLLLCEHGNDPINSTGGVLKGELVVEDPDYQSAFNTADPSQACPVRINSAAIKVYKNRINNINKLFNSNIIDTNNKIIEKVLPRHDFKMSNFSAHYALDQNSIIDYDTGDYKVKFLDIQNGKPTGTYTALDCPTNQELMMDDGSLLTCGNLPNGEVYDQFENPQNTLSVINASSLLDMETNSEMYIMNRQYRIYRGNNINDGFYIDTTHDGALHQPFELYNVNGVPNLDYSVGKIEFTPNHHLIFWGWDIWNADKVTWGEICDIPNVKYLVFQKVNGQLEMNFYSGGTLSQPTNSIYGHYEWLAVDRW